MNNDQITNLLTVILIVMLGVLFLLLIVFMILKVKENKKDKPRVNKPGESKNGIAPKSSKEQIEYNKQSIFSFMKFDKIEDNMIIRKNGTKFLMAIECQGINYDLMSGVEKTSVEQGFLQFLNTLRHPIQIYTQTRTVNLGSSIMKYKERIKDVENRLVSKQMDYNSKANSGQYTEEELLKEKLEVVRERNLYEYGRDIINNTERMSLNKNILRKHYYIIIAYTPEEISNPNFGKEEIKDMAFGELYTKCQSAVSSLAVCGINGKILNSNELAELLYVAYNRDDSEIYQLDQALNARYDELYSTAQDVLDRKMKELDKKVEAEAIRKANEVLLEVAEETEKEREVKKKEENLNELIAKMAKIMIDENENIVGKEMASKAKKKIDNETTKAKTKAKEKGGEKNGEKEKTTTRGRKKAV